MAFGGQEVLKMRLNTSTGQKGFTLIELMIVIAIVGILASIAIPSYRDYVLKTRVSEGMSLASGPKTGVTEHFDVTGTWPANNAEAGLDAPATISGDSVSSVVVAGNQITVTYQGEGLNGDTLVIEGTANAGSISWVCNAASSSVDDGLLPSSCR